MIFRPFGDRVLVIEHKGQREMEGVILPDSAREDFRAGTVLSVGRGAVNERGEVVPMEAQPGMKVLFGPYAGIPIQIADQELLVLREGELAGVIEIPCQTPEAG